MFREIHKLSITGLTFWVCECNGYNRNDYVRFFFIENLSEKTKRTFFHILITITSLQNLLKTGIFISFNNAIY